MAGEGDAGRTCVVSRVPEATLGIVKRIKFFLGEPLSRPLRSINPTKRDSDVDPAHVPRGPTRPLFEIARIGVLDLWDLRNRISVETIGPLRTARRSYRCPPTRIGCRSLGGRLRRGTPRESRSTNTPRRWPSTGTQLGSDHVTTPGASLSPRHGPSAIIVSTGASAVRESRHPCGLRGKCFEGSTDIRERRARRGETNGRSTACTTT